MITEQQQRVIISYFNCECYFENHCHSGNCFLEHFHRCIFTFSLRNNNNNTQSRFVSLPFEPHAEFVQKLQPT